MDHFLIRILWHLLLKDTNILGSDNYGIIFSIFYEESIIMLFQNILIPFDGSKCSYRASKIALHGKKIQLESYATNYFENTYLTHDILIVV